MNKLTALNLTIMDNAETTGEFDASISAVWRIADRSLPYPASTIVRAEARDEEVSGLASAFDAAVAEFARDMQCMIGERTGLSLSEADVTLLRCAIFHQAICDQISAIRSVDLAEVADNNPLVALELAQVMFKEKFHE